MIKSHNDISFLSIVLKSLFYNTDLNELIQKNKMTNVCEYSYIELLNILKEQLVNYNFRELECLIHSFIRCYNSNEKRINFFNIIFAFSDKMISYRDENYRFKYEYTDIWRNYTKNVDEEITVISAIFQDDMRKRNYCRTSWDWPYCIEHDNYELISLLKRDNGVSENHFHLRGSSSYFYISWILLMNNIFEPKYEENFLQIENNRLNKTKNSDPISLICMKAAAIRLYLYSIIVDDRVLFEEYFIEKSEFISDTKKFAFKYNNEYEKFDYIPLKYVKKYYCTSQIAFKIYKKYCHRNMYAWLINEVLSCNNIKLFPTKLIQELIEKWNVVGINNENIDYAQNSVFSKNKKYFTLSGERYFLYHTLKKIYQRNDDHKKVESLLYMYLHAKHQFRVELVQSNAYIGFHNFQDYQDRKDYFIPWSAKFEEKMIADTICSIMETPKIHRAELRISPRSTVKENIENIQICENAISIASKYINNQMGKDDKGTDLYYTEINLKNKFFYTLHFIKKSDSVIQMGHCRNYTLRKETEQQANAIMELRHSHINTAKRILGIDAAGEEINCRPEIYGTVFRLLMYYDKHSVNLSNTNHLHQIKATYHVGEDNYDIVDGIRAIDEAILFLDLRSGCRLGHATLLGLPAKAFYEKKKNTVHMPRQIFLDNIVWMYFFIKNNAVYFDDLALLMSYLEEQFQVHFNKIYLNGIRSSFVNNLIDKIPFPKHNSIPSSKELCNFDIYHYYLSWLLRGDDPDLYINGYFKPPYIESDAYRICRSNEKISIARESFEAGYLYYLYHYNISSRELGDHEINVPLPKYFIKAVQIIQKEMAKKIEKSGIAIETNPSSNLFISTIESYDEHPISNFYDNWLKKNPQETQLNVSINTDDKSIFSTCLSNEYAYLAFYLENKRDENGDYFYNHFEIYNWLDSIRRMGNEQSFEND